jgi:hypothetical protein
MLLPPIEFARKFSELLESSNIRQEDILQYTLDCKPDPFGSTASVQLTGTGVERLAEKLSREIEFLPSRSSSRQRAYGFIADTSGYNLEVFYHENFP